MDNPTIDFRSGSFNITFSFKIFKQVVTVPNVTINEREISLGVAFGVEPITSIVCISLIETSLKRLLRRLVSSMTNTLLKMDVR